MERFSIEVQKDRVFLKTQIRCRKVQGRRNRSLGRSLSSDCGIEKLRSSLEVPELYSW